MNTNTVSMRSTLNIQQVHLWQVFTVLALMLMDLSWITAGFTLLVESQVKVNAGQVFLVLGGIYLATYLVATALQYLELEEGLSQIVLLVIAIAGLIWAVSSLLMDDGQLKILGVIRHYLSSFRSLSVLFKPEFLLTITIILLWRRALTIARHAVGPRFVRRAFNSGILAFVMIGVVAAGLGRTLPTVGAAVFLFSGLMAMGGARLSFLSRTRGGRGIPFSREWVMGLTLLASGILAFAGAMGLLAGGPFSVWIGEFIAYIGGLIAQGLLRILGPLLFVLARALDWVFGIIEPVMQGLPREPIEVSTSTGMEDAVESLNEIQSLAWASRLGSIMSAVLAVGVLLLLFWTFLYTVRRFKLGGKTWGMPAGDEITISGSIADYLRTLLQTRAQRTIEGFSRLNSAARFLAAARIRRIYANLLKLGANKGEQRSPADTPLEYMSHLERVFPSSHAELATITHAYLRVRYGELPETREQVEDVESAWERINSQARLNREAG